MAVCFSMLTRAALLTIALSAKESAHINRIPLALHCLLPGCIAICDFVPSFRAFRVYPRQSQIVQAQPEIAYPRRARLAIPALSGEPCSTARFWLSRPCQAAVTFVNVLAGFPAAAITFFVFECCEKSAKPSNVVNEVTRLDPVRVPYGLFRASVEQKGEAQAACD